MSEDGKCVIVRDIYEKLRELSIDSRIKEPADAGMALNSSFLVDKDRESEFQTRVNELDEKYGDRLRFKYAVGPVPPYNFVSIEVEWK